MLNKRVLKLLVIAIAIPIAGYSIFEKVTRAQRETPKPDERVTINPQIRGRDLRRHPPLVEKLEATLLRRATAGGNVLLTAKFAKEERVPRAINVDLDGKTVTFHDDGRDGDRSAGDGVHSAITTVDLAAAQAELARRTRFKSSAVPVFRGRERVMNRQVNKSLELTRFRPGIPIDLTPEGDPANIDSNRSLMVNDPSVVQDPGRTRTTCNGASMGKWSFGYLMQEMANQAATGVNPQDFVMNWLNKWKVAQVPNDIPVAARPNINNIIASWPKVGGKLDLSRAPFRLLAIVNRADLRGSFSYGGGGAGNGGELRFVFAVVDPNAGCSPQPFTVIFEYGVKKTTCNAMKNWAQQWKNLDTLAIGSAAYNTALEAITEQIVKAGANPAKPNGSALNQLRTNERDIGVPWELREFVVSGSGFLRQDTVKQNPDAGFNTTATLGDYVNQDESAILMDRHTVPVVFGPSSDAFLGGAAPVPGDNSNFRWTSNTISNLEARFHYSLNTCNSCHAGETQTSVFTHVEVTGFGNTTAGLSRFLRGATPDTNDIETFDVNDPFNGNVRHYNDLNRRAVDLDQLINTPCFVQFAIKPLAMVH